MILRGIFAKEEQVVETNIVYRHSILLISSSTHSTQYLNHKKNMCIWTLQIQHDIIKKYNKKNSNANGQTKVKNPSKVKIIQCIANT